MLNSDRGRIQPPDLDDRTWQDLVDQALGLIPQYAPQWTDVSPGDPGRALVELFAWLVEGLTYRLNRVPEKNYVAFLNLLGITRDPEVPAHTFLTFQTQPSATAPVLVPKQTKAQTQGTEVEAPLVFETDEDALILPNNLRSVLLVRRDLSPVIATDITSTLANAMVSGYTLNLPGAPIILSGQTTSTATPLQLLLGFDAATTQVMNLALQLTQPVQVTTTAGVDQPQIAVSWSYSTGSSEPLAWSALTSSGTPPALVDNTSGLLRDGTVSLTIPGNWGAQAPSSWQTVSTSLPGNQGSNALFWIGITLLNQISATSTQAAPSVPLGFNYVLFNSVSAHNALTIAGPELLGQSDGTTPLQTFQLKHHPLFKRPNTDTPYDHLTIQVDGVTWTQVDDFPAGPGNFYRLNPVTGEISFGNYDSTQAQPGTHGTIPLKGAQITALTYRYVAGGVSGNVGAGQVNALTAALPGIASVNNLSASFDAADEETIEDTLQRAPLELKSGDRAVTAGDYELLAVEANNEVAIVRCLPPRLHTSQESGPWNTGDPWTFANVIRAPGNVNVIIVPNQGTGTPRPAPSKDLLQEVQAYLDLRRDITAALRVSGPYYLPISVTASVTVWQKAIFQGLVSSANDVIADMTKKLQLYLHPIYGGLDGKGWQVGQSVFSPDLFKAIMPDESVGFITALSLAAETPAYLPAARPTPPAGDGGSWVSVADYELICCGTPHISANPSI